MKNYDIVNGVPVKSWCPNIEQGAMDQITDAAKHPAVFKHVALMPDAHQGYGVPIGAVVALDQAVSPNMVGVDIGCTDSETEYLTRFGWKKISEYDNENIMIYHKESDSCFFSNPNAYIVKDCDEFTHLDSQRVDQMLSDEHNVILFSSRTGKSIDGNVLNWVSKNKSLKKGVSQQFKNILPNVNVSSVSLSHNQLRLIMAISADGCIRSTGKIEFHLKKSRKISRLKELFSLNNITESEFNLKDDSYGCSFKFDLATKDLSFLFGCDRDQAKVALNEAMLWDGHIANDGQLNYYSTIKKNIDAMQYVFALCDTRANFYKQPARDGHENWSNSYILYSTNNSMTCFPYPDKIKRVKSADGKSYCFTTSTGYWVMRRNGKIVITGNCGMSATKTSLKDISKEDLNYLRYRIEKAIPVGMSTRGEIVDNDFPINECFEFLSQFGDKFSKNYQKKVEKSIGTLGGGNHFIEIQKGDDGNIWVMIHSGSRNLGYSIANYFNEIAKSINSKYKTERNDVAQDLAFLSTSEKEGLDYIKAMSYALDYAKENRKVMMNIVMGEINAILSEEHKLKINSKDCRLKTIDVHHNYAGIENHFGKNVWVHRKGAISAKDGELGIIPGSMGANSYIVIGCGNKMSFNSCSHGAGRNFSRTKATLELDLEEQDYIMSDVVFAGWSKVKRGNKKVRGKIDLGEAPGAYKDISMVMENQRDLVDTYVELTPLMVIKG